MARWNSRMPMPMAGEATAGAGLQRSLGRWHLLALGIGATLTMAALSSIGRAVAQTGPTFLIVLVVAALIVGCVALAYAELAAMIPISGSSYSYAYVALGELAAWIAGLSLILQFAILGGLLADYWSAHLAGIAADFGYVPPEALSMDLASGGLVDLPAVVIVLVLSGLLAWNARAAASLNLLLVGMVLTVPILLLAMLIAHFEISNVNALTALGDIGGPESPGFVALLSVFLLTFVGFDAVAPAAEEARNPARDTALGMIGPVVLCTLLWLAISVAAIGAIPYPRFEQEQRVLRFIAGEWGGAALVPAIVLASWAAALTVLFACLYALSRIFHAMARDRMLPGWFAAVSESGNPARATLLAGILMAGLAGLVPVQELENVGLVGMLVAFLLTVASWLTLRIGAPEAPRPFRAPLAWPVGLVAVVGCVAVLASQPFEALWKFALWAGAGMVSYLFFGRRRSFTVVLDELRDEGMETIVEMDRG